MKDFHLDRSQRKMLEDFLDHTEVVSYTPPDEQIATRLRDLKALGLLDQPEFRGLSSPVRQYALNSLIAQAGHLGPPPIIFITEHAGLLRQSRLLEIRYGLRPMSPQAVVEDQARQQEEED
jgi:hypothetical protein